VSDANLCSLLWDQSTSWGHRGKSQSARTRPDRTRPGPIRKMVAAAVSSRSSSQTGRHRAPAGSARHRQRSTGKSPVPAIEYGRGELALHWPTATGYAHYIGRVGALAVALGVGAALASTPALAFAYDAGSPGSTSSASSSATGSSPSTTHPGSGTASSTGTAPAGGAPTSAEPNCPCGEQPGVVSSSTTSSGSGASTGYCSPPIIA